MVIVRDFCGLIRVVSLGVFFCCGDWVWGNEDCCGIGVYFWLVKCLIEDVFFVVIFVVLRLGGGLEDVIVGCG